MKDLKYFLRILIIGLIFSNICYAVTPTYKLTAKNFNYTSSNTLEFDIYIKNTSSSPTVNFFEYSTGQYMFNVDPLFANGNLTYTVVSPQPVINPQLPPSLVPGLPVVFQNQLRIKNLNMVSPGAGPIISSTGDGTFVVRMKLITSGNFVQCRPSISWRNQIDGGFYTKLIAYTYNTDNPGENITNPANHFIEASNVVNVLSSGMANGSGYPNLYEAFNDINAGNHGSGSITVNINCNTIEPNNAVLNGGVFASCLIKPTANVSVTASSGAEKLIVLNGAENVTIDGRIDQTGDKELKFINGNSTNATSCISLLNGAADNNIQFVNCEMSDNEFEIGANAIEIATSAMGTGGNNYNKIEGCLITGGRTGISVFGKILFNTVYFTNYRNKIINDTVNDCRQAGIVAGNNSKDTQIEDNVIYNKNIINNNNSFSAIRFNGVGVENFIKKNKIYNLTFNGMVYNLIGIEINSEPASVGSSSTVLNVNNNFISLGENPLTTNVVGILTSTIVNTITINNYYNSIFISGAYTGGYTSYSKGIEFQGDFTNSIYHQKNNISINERTSASENDVGASIRFVSTVTVDIDYNCYWSTGNIARWKVTSSFQSQLPKYQCDAFPNEQNTNFKDVSFVDKINGDLHLNLYGDYDLMGLSGLATIEDIDLQGRSTTSPYMGADEGIGTHAFTFSPTIRLRVYLDGCPPPREEPITVELWNRNASGQENGVIGIYPVTLSTSGTGIINPSPVPAGSFFIVVKHSGYIETWSRAAGETFSTIPGQYLNYDFTTASGQSYGDNLKLCCNKYFIFSGLTENTDGFIDALDCIYVTSDKVSGGVPRFGRFTDLDFDGDVDADDECLVNENAAWYPFQQIYPHTPPDQYVNRPDDANASYGNVIIEPTPYICSCSPPH